MRECWGPSAEPLTKLFRSESGESKIIVAQLMNSFDASTRGLLFSAKVMDGRTVRIETSTGVNLTCDMVLGALHLREERRRIAADAPATPAVSQFMRRAIAERKRRNLEDTDEALKGARKVMRAFLVRTRSQRRALRRANAAVVNREVQEADVNRDA